jgi:hypothetical protein
LVVTTTTTTTTTTTAAAAAVAIVSFCNQHTIDVGYVTNDTTVFQVV